MDAVVLIVFLVVYGGMALGRIPGLAMDRTGIALLGALALIVFERVTPEDARLSIDIPTVALLFALMVVSVQFRLAGAYTALTRRIATADLTPDALLAMVILASGMLSAVLGNDIVCLAMTPPLMEACARRGLKPIPFLLALACATNVGSAATLIGNPQNILIGQSLRISFASYLLDGGVPAVLGLFVVWWIIRRQSHGCWHGRTEVPQIEAPGFRTWQAFKGLAILLALMAALLWAPLPGEILGLAAAGIVLTNRQMHSRQMLGLVDWQLIVLFVALFIVNHAVQSSGLLIMMRDGLSDVGIDVRSPVSLFGVTVVLSNIVSNVPAVMLLLPSASHPLAGPILALASTLAGNLFIVGSIANIIVVDQAEQLGVRITWKEHARVGIPVTLATLIVAIVWLWMRARSIP